MTDPSKRRPMSFERIFYEAVDAGFRGRESDFATLVVLSPDLFRDEVVAEVGRWQRDRLRRRMQRAGG